HGPLHPGEPSGLCHVPDRRALLRDPSLHADLPHRRDDPAPDPINGPRIRMDGPRVQAVREEPLLCDQSELAAEPASIRERRRHHRPRNRVRNVHPRDVFLAARIPGTSSPSVHRRGYLRRLSAPRLGILGEPHGASRSRRCDRMLTVRASPPYYYASVYALDPATFFAVTNPEPWYFRETGPDAARQ